jgi:predicted HNH restriction endonuclease
MFKAQSLASVYMSDTAAENAARQFNASSQDQVGMFFSNLQTNIQQFNNEQANAMEKFNAGEANAISQFNAAQQNARDQFNASQALVVEQANAQWEQSITTMDNAAQNQANRDAAIAANGYTETTYNNMLQQERDALDYAWRTADNAMQRENSLLISEMQTQASVDQARGEGAGKLLEIGTTFLLNKFLPGSPLKVS